MKRIIAKLDVKGPNLVKGINLEGLRVLGEPGNFAKSYYKKMVDEIIYHEAFGFSDIDNQIPMKTNSIFRIASQTKFITATAIMMLQERGDLVITENVSKYIPEFKETFVAKKSDNGYSIEPAEREITIIDLLTHTSGIGYGFGIASEVWEDAGIQGFYLIDRNESIVELSLIHI